MMNVPFFSGDSKPHRGVRRRVLPAPFCSHDGTEGGSQWHCIRLVAELVRVRLPTELVRVRLRATRLQTALRAATPPQRGYPSRPRSASSAIPARPAPPPTRLL